MISTNRNPTPSGYWLHACHLAGRNLLNLIGGNWPMTNLDLLTLMLRAKVLTCTLTGDITTLEEFVLLQLDEFNRFPHSEGYRIAHKVLELAIQLREGLIDEAEVKKQLRGAFGIPSTLSHGETS